MAVAVVPEENHVNEQQGKPDEHQQRQPPGYLVFYLDNQQDTEQNFTGNDGSRRQRAPREVQDVETVDVQLELVKRQQFQYRRHDEKQTDPDPYNRFQNILTLVHILTVDFDC